jgi:hypothetical protein
MSKITLSTPCYFVENGEVKESTLESFDRYIETTTRPAGVGPKYYATTVSRPRDAVYDADDNLIEPAGYSDVWALAYWATWGGPERVIQEFATEEEAVAAAEALYVQEILDNGEMAIYLDRQGAENELRMILEAED